MCLIYGFVEVIKVILVKHYPHAVKGHSVLVFQFFFDFDCLVYKGNRCSTFALNLYFSNGRDMILDESFKVVWLCFCTLTDYQETYKFLTDVFLTLFVSFGFFVFPL